MANHQQQNLYDKVIGLLAEAEAVMVGVNDPELWWEVGRVGAILQCQLDGEAPGILFEPWGDQPEILPGSPAARAIALVKEAGAAIREIRQPRLALAAQLRLVMVNGLMSCAGELEMPLGDPRDDVRWE